MHRIFVLKKVVEKVNTHLMSSTFFSVNYAVYETELQEIWHSQSGQRNI
jgi:hypothetical protein